MFNEAPKLIRQLPKADGLQRGIQQGLKIGLDVGLSALAAAAGETQPAITAGRPVTEHSVPTAHRARRVVYAPDLDGRADPGEIVWTWVVYEDDPTRGKDRPVLVVGRDQRTLLGLMLSSQDHHHDDRRLGRDRQRQLGLRGHGPAGCGWTGCSTCPRRASAARARSSTARPSR